MIAIRRPRPRSFTGSAIRVTALLGKAATLALYKGGNFRRLFYSIVFGLVQNSRSPRSTCSRLAGANDSLSKAGRIHAPIYDTSEFTASSSVYIRIRIYVARGSDTDL
jgi:hypothetical protein